MICVGLDPVTGWSDWLCGDCHRRLRVWLPNLRATKVLAAGDDSVIHHGIGAGVVTSSHYGAIPLGTSDFSDEDRGWLTRLGIDWEGSGASGRAPGTAGEEA
jgi:hypothetical protein